MPQTATQELRNSIIVRVYDKHGSVMIATLKLEHEEVRKKAQATQSQEDAAELDCLNKLITKY